MRTMDISIKVIVARDCLHDVICGIRSILREDYYSKQSKLGLVITL